MFLARFVDCAAAQSLSVWAVIIMHDSCGSKLILQVGRLLRCAPTPAIMRERWFVGLLAVPLRPVVVVTVFRHGKVHRFAVCQPQSFEEDLDVFQVRFPALAARQF